MLCWYIFNDKHIMEYANRCYFKTMITAMKNVNSFTCSVFFLIRNVKTQVHRGSWALTWWQLRNVIYVTTAITSDNLVCEISPLWTNLLFSILQSVFHYFTIFYEMGFFEISMILPIFLSQGLFSLIAFVYHIDDIPWSANI